MRLLPFIPLAVLLPCLFPAKDYSLRPDWMGWAPEWLAQVTLFETARWQWILLALMLALSGPISGLVRMAVSKTLEARFGGLKDVAGWNSGIGIRRSAGLLLSSLLWYGALPLLELSERVDSGIRFLIQTASIVGAVWLVYSIWDAICDSISERASSYGRRTEKLLIPITRKLVGALILIGGLFLALTSYGVNVYAIVTGLGIGGLIIALAAKDSVENLFGSVTLLFDTPFAVGDWVKIGPVEGAVEEINLRSTRIRTSEDSVITLPNSNLIRASVENLGARRHHRVRTTLSVSSQVSAERLQAWVEQIREVIQRHPKTRKSGFQVELFELTMTEAHILVNFFIDADDYTQELRYRGEILMELKRTAESLGLEPLAAPAPESAAGAPGSSSEVPTSGTTE